MGRGKEKTERDGKSKGRGDGDVDRLREGGDGDRKGEEEMGWRDYFCLHNAILRLHVHNCDTTFIVQLFSKTTDEYTTLQSRVGEITCTSKTMIRCTVRVLTVVLLRSVSSCSARDCSCSSSRLRSPTWLSPGSLD